MAWTVIQRSIHDFPTLSSLERSLFETSDETAHITADWRLHGYDVKTSVPNVNDPLVEARRLENLLSYNVLDTASDPEMDDLTQNAVQVFNVQIAAISIIDFGRQWFKSITGLDGVSETPRQISFCAHTMHRKNECGSVMVVPDATNDKRFKNNPLVADPEGLGIRFYAGAPIRSPEGHILGVFCIVDTKPRPEGLTQVEQRNLQNLADCAMANILMSL